ncbi:SBBP repeat-containing protein [Mechercharimyces sp. CAU 1602]|uniref:SBBP repeat-containing protein n=1 Tax=Mechercharimyces sp. CAU 1602 TaxID=2973933 RepID=UPI0028681B9C|nr:SBBP repeat-containing protein [Mechercharimyces sp. CAU 1602]
MRSVEESTPRKILSFEKSETTENRRVRFKFLKDGVLFKLNQSSQLMLQFKNTCKGAYPRGVGQSRMSDDLHFCYEKVVYKGVWAGIDIIFSFSEGALKYDIYLEPGSNVRDIRLSYDGAQALFLDEQGNLQIYTPTGVFLEKKPLSFQYTKGREEGIETRFILLGESTFGFKVEGYYDEMSPLVIDPVIFYSSYVGVNNLNLGITADSVGNAYVTGFTDSTAYPVTSGSFQSMFAGGDAFITKLNSAGSSLIYSTYLGGTSVDVGFDIALDTLNNVYVTGSTQSTNFPVTSNAFQTMYRGGTDAFVTKINSLGSSLIYSTYLGGTSFDTGNGIAVDATGSAYVTGSTDSTNFPITSGSFQTMITGDREVFVLKLSSTGSSLIYSSYLGGDLVDSGNGIAVDTSGSAYVTGFADSTNFPVTSGAFQTMATEGISAFVTKMSPLGMSLIYSTYLGGSQNDFGRGIALDGANQAYIGGFTSSSTNFPVTANAFQTLYGGGSFDGFVARLNPSGSKLQYSTYLGGSDTDVIGLSTSFQIMGSGGVAIDSFGYAWVTGITRSTNFPVTSDAFQDSNGGESDAFVTKISFSGQGLSFSSYLGGGSSDEGVDVAVDSRDSAFMTGDTNSTNFPVTFQAYQTQLLTPPNGFVTRIDSSLGTGQTGATGPTGPTGATGSQGTQGSRGPRGLRGRRGPRGPRGSSGGETGL